MPENMTTTRCILIPAIKKNAAIPDQLVKKLAGVTLIQRALNTANALLSCQDIHVVTDSEEISLICQRNGVNYHYNKSLRFRSGNILVDLKGYLDKLAANYDHILVYRASAPLVDHQDIQNGYNLFLKADADILITLKKQEQRLWRKKNGTVDQLIGDERTDSLLVEIRSFLIVQSRVLDNGHRNLKIMPHYLDEKAVEIESYQDWWICEKLLQQKHIVFVVTGYPAIGLGHIFRSLTLAHEIMDHRITFLCTRESELAVRQIAERDYKTVLQQGKLVEDVLELKPDLVVNDILSTDTAYIKRLKQNAVKVVNFEDSGPGAAVADLVINALFSPDNYKNKNCLCGPQYFCLRDEFENVKRGKFRSQVETVLVTFGGTDPGDFTLQTLQAILDICANRNIFIFVVTGPGYLHKDSLVAYLKRVAYKDIRLIDQTGIMSSIMEKADLAISSAGRTVYELAHMRVPGIVLAQHSREHMHTFPRSENGFAYVGAMHNFDTKKLQDVFYALLDRDSRKQLYERMEPFDFSSNKKKVVKKLLSFVE